MKQSKSMAYLRQLCCLGLNKDMVINEFLVAVRTVLPSGINIFSQFDGSFNPIYFLRSSDAPVMDEFTLITVFNFFTPECKAALAGWFSKHPVFTELTLVDRAFYRSDMYNVVYKSNDQHHTMIAPVTCAGMPVGTLNLFRPRHNRPFNSREQVIMSYLVQYLGHAYLVASGDKGQYISNELSGILIMDNQGQVVYLSGHAKHLLSLACQPSLTRDPRQQENLVMQQLAQLCRNLNTIFYGQHAAPPSWVYGNGNGRFIFHACWLNKQNNEPAGLIAINIEHQEPITLKVLRAMQGLPLSPIQREVILLIVQGLSNEQIGDKLHIKLTTVKDHISKIFTKLDINRRDELLPKLLALEK